MFTSINMTTSSQDMMRFCDKADLRNFYKDLEIDGLELMLIDGLEVPNIITKEDINGIHLNFVPYWYDFWKKDMDALKKIFGTQTAWEKYYGSPDPIILVDHLKKELEAADALGVKYVVFHVSESAPDECLTYQMTHTDEEICDAAAEMINTALDGKDYHFDFLCENLWWSGLTMTKPDIVKRLMEQIHYEKKGIMLDTGHLLHTNRNLRTQEQALSYIHEILDKNKGLCKYIKGIHLQQSLTGTYVEEYLKKKIELSLSYEEKLMLLYPHIFQIDQHKPFTANGVKNLIERIHPQYLTYELISENNTEHLKMLKAQLVALES